VDIQIVSSVGVGDCLATRLQTGKACETRCASARSRSADECGLCSPAVLLVESKSVAGNAESKLRCLVRIHCCGCCSGNPRSTLRRLTGVVCIVTAVVHVALKAGVAQFLLCRSAMSTVFVRLKELRRRRCRHTKRMAIGVRSFVRCCHSSTIRRRCRRRRRR